MKNNVLSFFLFSVECILEESGTSIAPPERPHPKGVTHMASQSSVSLVQPCTENAKQASAVQEEKGNINKEVDAGNDKKDKETEGLDKKEQVDTVEEEMNSENNKENSNGEEETDDEEIDNVERERQVEEIENDTPHTPPQLHEG